MPTSDIEPEVRARVAEVLVRYATAIDTRDWGLLRTCFADDCDADYGDIGHWETAEELVAWMAQMHDPLGPSMHQLSNITMSAGADGITTRAYVHGVIVVPDRTVAIHVYGWYDDLLVETATTWQVARRRYVPTFTESSPAMG
jgi:hypothetical protein